jgi:hypothetical protein
MTTSEFVAFRMIPDGRAMLGPPPRAALRFVSRAFADPAAAIRASCRGILDDQQSGRVPRGDPDRQAICLALQHGNG